MEAYCISCDWLQVYCHGAPIKEHQDVGADGYVFHARPRSIVTPIYHNSYDVYLNNKVCAEIYQNPRVTFMHPSSTGVRLKNEILYTTEFVAVLYAIFRAYNLDYKGITRLDLCYDCNKLAGGRSVTRFIDGFLHKPIFTAGHVIRVGSPKFMICGSRKPSSATIVDSIYWGSPRSAITAHLYNKTLELLEVKDKQYIRQKWKQAGLVSAYLHDYDDLSDDQKKKCVEDAKVNEKILSAVWRFELSIKAEGSDIIDASTGVLFRLSPDYMQTQIKMEELFFIYAKRAFHFRVFDGKKRIRDYKDLQLFERKEVDTYCAPINLRGAVNVGRTEKVLYNYLTKAQFTYHDFSPSLIQAIELVRTWLARLGGQKAWINDLESHNQYLRDFCCSERLSDYDKQLMLLFETIRRTKQEIPEANDIISWETVQRISPPFSDEDVEKYLNIE